MKRPSPKKAGSASRSLTFESYIPFLVNRTATAMLFFAAAAFTPHGLTVPKWRVLFLLWERERCLFGECSELTSIGVPTLSRLTAKLERERLIARTRVPTDTRTLELSITAKGRVLVESLMPETVATEKMYLDGVTAEERTALRSALGKIYNNIARHGPVVGDDA